MYKVYTADEVIEVETLEEAKNSVAAEWDISNTPNKTGFINPWIEDEDGNQIEYTPTAEDIAMWQD